MECKPFEAEPNSTGTREKETRTEDIHEEKRLILANGGEAGGVAKRNNK